MQMSESLLNSLLPKTSPKNPTRASIKKKLSQTAKKSKLFRFSLSNLIDYKKDVSFFPLFLSTLVFHGLQCTQKKVCFIFFHGHYYHDKCIYYFYTYRFSPTSRLKFQFFFLLGIQKACLYRMHNMLKQ